MPAENGSNLYLRNGVLNVHHLELSAIHLRCQNPKEASNLAVATWTMISSLVCSQKCSLSIALLRFVKLQIWMQLVAISL